MLKRIQGEKIEMDQELMFQEKQVNVTWGEASAFGLFYS